MLRVPGGSLYYEVRGHGPTLLMIPGGGGDAGFFTGVAERLAGRFRVVTYDRRGNSRSVVDEPAGYSIATQVDDAVRLLENLGSGPAHVFGSSLGGVVGLDLAARYPELVETLVVHEPPVLAVLPDPEPARRRFREVRAAYDTGGVVAAVAKMSAHTDPSEIVDGDPVVSARLAANVGFFVAQEMLPTVAYEPDLAALKASGTPVVVGVGEPRTDTLSHDIGKALAVALDTEPVEFPSYHQGFFTAPEPFAARLGDLLAR